MLSAIPRDVFEPWTMTPKACWTRNRRRWQSHAFAVVVQGSPVWRGIGESMPPRLSAESGFWLFDA